MPPPRLILASASPARLTTLRNAGLDPEVVVSGIDESDVEAASPAELALRLAQLKTVAVAAHHPRSLVIGCDSVLEFAGEAFGKPADAQEAGERWRRMRGASGVLHTGHCVMDTHREVWLGRSAATHVRFAELTDDEVDAYVASGEPLQVAGGFTIDGRGAAYVSGITGDPHNVVGISVPLLRVMFAELGFVWHDFWVAATTP